MGWVYCGAIAWQQWGNRNDNMRNKHYNTFSQRLNDKNIDWLKKESKKYKSWNLFFNELKRRYKGDKT